MFKSIFQRIASFVALCIFASSAFASDYNIDFGTASPIPATTYGAAANNPGFWNVYAGGTQNNLQDLTSAVTGVSIAQSGAGFLGSFNDPLTTGDDEALLDDFMQIPFIDFYTISGLPAGTYGVYTYTWTFGPLSTGMIVNSQSQQVIGGAWPGSHVLGMSYAYDTTTIATNQPIVIEVDSIGGTLGAISGVQIVTSVPSPSCAIPGLVWIAGVITGRRRR